MQVIIDSDLDGISGICCWEQARDSTSLPYQQGRHLLTAEINACVEGCLVGGADEVLVEDNHGYGFNIIRDAPSSSHLYGRNRHPFLCWQDQFPHTDAAILLGYHAMAGTLGALLCHTQTAAIANRYWHYEYEW